MESTPLAGWSEFGVAAAGAAAALAGLLIVAISVNVREILAYAPLVSRAAATVGTLVLALVAGLLLLIPGQPVAWFGVEVMAATAVALIFDIDAIVRAVRFQPRRPLRELLSTAAMSLVPRALFVAGGILLIVSGWGVGFIAAGIVLAIVAATVNSWVLLVEILR